MNKLKSLFIIACLALFSCAGGPSSVVDNKPALPTGRELVAEYIERKTKQREAGITLKNIGGVADIKNVQMACVDFGSTCFVEFPQGLLQQSKLYEIAERVCEDEKSIVSYKSELSSSTLVEPNGHKFEFRCLNKKIAAART